jgi:cytochrome c oxidase subunit 4
MTAESPSEHVVAYGTYLRVWLALVGLTGLLLVAGRLYHESLSVPALLTITPLKAGLVFYYFMHLRHERPYIRGMVFVALGTLTLFLSVLFLDLSFR